MYMCILSFHFIFFLYILGFLNAVLLIMFQSFSYSKAPNFILSSVVLINYVIVLFSVDCRANRL